MKENVKVGSFEQMKANKIIAEKIATAYQLIKECENIADKYGLSFAMEVSYGMGGTYESGSWQSSSQSC